MEELLGEMGITCMNEAKINEQGKTEHEAKPVDENQATELNNQDLTVKQSAVVEGESCVFQDD